MKLVPLHNQRHVLPSQVWLSTKGVADYQVSLDVPAGPSILLPHLKEWLLDPDRRTNFVLSNGRSYLSDVQPEKVARAFFRELVKRLPPDTQGNRSYCLLTPALVPHNERLAYQKLLETALRKEVRPQSQIHFLFEPDCVLEYFRLVRGELDLPEGENHAVLVVDCGALTCNMTLVFTTQSGDIGEGTTGRSRGPLQAITGTSIKTAGHKVDRDLWQEAASSDEGARLSIDASVGLRLMEVLKIRVGATQQPCQVISPDAEFELEISPERLRTKSDELWQGYSGTLQHLLDKAFKQLQSARAYRDVLTTRGVHRPTDLPRLLRAVILAGGSSRLPGFEKATLNALGRPDLRVLRVGDDYPVSAALGGMAHILSHAGNLRPVSSIQQSQTPYRPLLQQEIHLAWEVSGEWRSKVIVPLEDEVFPTVYEDNGMTDALPHALTRRRKQPVRVGLCLGPTEAGATPNWIPSHLNPITLREVGSYERLRIRWDSRAQELVVVFESSSVSHVALRGFPLLPPQHGDSNDTIVNDVFTRILQADEHSDRLEGVICRAVNHVVIDFGMSKTLVAMCDEDKVISWRDFAHTAMEAEPELPAGWRLVEGQVEESTQSSRETKEFDSDPVALEEVPGQVPAHARHTVLLEGLADLPDPTDGGAVSSSDSSDANRTAIPSATGSEPSMAPSEPSPPEPEPIHVDGSDSVEAVTSIGDLEAPDDQPSAVAESLGHTEQVKPATHSGESQILRRRPAGREQFDIGGEVEFLQTLVQRTADSGLDVTEEDIVTLHIACKVRPLILLAGPPGAGKTSLAHLYATALGCATQDRGFLRVPVQAHWIDDTALHSTAEGQLSIFSAVCQSDTNHLNFLLMDEFNVTRPEYYLSRLLSEMEYDGKISRSDGMRLPRTPGNHHAWLMIGTLNIDETSRPPSDKVLDRSIVMECSPPRLSADGTLRRVSMPDPWMKVTHSMWDHWCGRPERGCRFPPELVPLCKILEEYRGHSLHESLAPSRRSVMDIAEFIEFQNRLQKDLPKLTRARSLDRLVVGRLLPRLRGPSRLLEPLIDKLMDEVKGLGDSVDLEDARKHLNAMKEQSSSGFISFWG